MVSRILCSRRGRWVISLFGETLGDGEVVAKGRFECWVLARTCIFLSLFIVLFCHSIFELRLGRMDPKKISQVG